ncbi:MAG TPA: S9 family peptidase, partial [Rhodothermales bacterium]|nr:S9 family peptidase [Rhodothermales bacterium]
YSFGGATWMPDGLKIILSGAPEGSTLHPDRLRDSDLYIVDADGSDLHRLLDIEGYALSSPSIAPNSRRVAFLARDLDDPGYAQTELGLFALDGRTPPEMLTLGFDRSLGDVKWSQDNWYLYFTAASEGSFPLYRLSVDEGQTARSPSITPEPASDDSLAADSLAANRARASFMHGEAVVRDLEIEQLTSTEQGIRDYDVSRATVYYVLTEPSNPYELYASTMDFDNPRRLTNHNASWLQNKRLATLEAYTLRRDTLQIPYWVMRPTNFDRGRDYPMLLEIHGGPSAMWGPGEATMWHEFQFMAAQGYGIVFSNPRGSGGYGHAYKALNYQDWGDGPGGDVLAVATDALRENRWLDADRQVVTGGSYAGYLTAWIVGHADRFKAAVAQRGVYDLSTFFGEGNAWRLVPSHFGGYPWEDGDADSIRDVLNYNSPLTYVDQITTPLLIIHSDKDLRTGVIQSEVLYKSLKALDRPVEYVRYPNAGHDLSRTGDPKQRMDRILRIYEFMERYIGPGASSASLD